MLCVCADVDFLPVHVQIRRAHLQWFLVQPRERGPAGPDRPHPALCQWHSSPQAVQGAFREELGHTQVLR